MEAGTLTKEGARLLDRPGVCSRGSCVRGGRRNRKPTKSGKRTGNVSAGTSVFAVIVLEKPLSVHREMIW
ncbi:MAG: hypothetical protein ACLURV_13175 [Gallintestinimicrobium sp.]